MTTEVRGERTSESPARPYKVKDRKGQWKKVVEDLKKRVDVGRTRQKMEKDYLGASDWLERIERKEKKN